MLNISHRMTPVLCGALDAAISDIVANVTLLG
jgi:hypothetical protein